MNEGTKNIDLCPNKVDVWQVSARQTDRQTGREGEEDEKNKKTGQNFGVRERKKERHRQTDKHRMHIIGYTYHFEWQHF